MKDRKKLLLFFKEFTPNVYPTLSKNERIALLLKLSKENTDKKLVETSIFTFLENKSIESERNLKKSLIPAYATLFTTIKEQSPQGLGFLVKVRSDLIEALNQTNVEQRQELQALNTHLCEKLSSWMLGFLDLERITWDSPGSLLEKISKYEAVHVIRGWKDLKQRMGPMRRIYSFFHRAMPQEPLVFIQVALMDSIESSVQRILRDTEQQVKEPTTAIFYSISSTQKGLMGVDLGNFLIKRVVTELSTEFPSLNCFSTLSPIPGFREWLEGKLQNQTEWNGISNKLSKVFGLYEFDWLKDVVANVYRIQTFKEGKERQVLKWICAFYLLQVKRGISALDPVANFHLRNGAKLYRLNWMGDTSAKGLHQSLGLMVNYKYTICEIEENSADYVCNGTIAINREDALLKQIKS